MSTKDRLLARIVLLKTPFERSSQDCACSVAMCSGDFLEFPIVLNLDPSARIVESTKDTSQGGFDGDESYTELRNVGGSWNRTRDK